MNLNRSRSSCGRAATLIVRIAWMGACWLLGVASAWAQGSPAETTYPSETVEALLAEGDTLYRQFDNRRALDAYEQAYRLDSARYAVLLRLARTHNDYGRDLLAEQNKDAAEQHFDQAVAYARALEAQYPEEAESYYQVAAAIGNLAVFKGGREKVKIGRAVEQYCRRAIALDATHAMAYVALGIFYREVAGLSGLQRAFAKVLFGGVPGGSMEDAVRMLERAVELEPELLAAHYELAWTYHAMNRPADAAAYWQKVLGLPPKSTPDLRSKTHAQEMLNH